MGLAALPWQELLPQLKQTIELDNSSGALYIIILLFVVGFGILNTVLMSITERFREYGVMLSLGMSQRKLVVAVALEIFFMLVIGFDNREWNRRRPSIRISSQHPITSRR